MFEVVAADAGARGRTTGRWDREMKDTTPTPRSLSRRAAGAAQDGSPYTITLQEAFAVLSDCAAVAVADDGSLAYPQLHELDGEDDNEFAYFAWNSHGLGYEVKFAEGENREVQVLGNEMTLVDTEGVPESFRILTATRISDILARLAWRQGT
jgi:hypothetical protein